MGRKRTLARHPGCVESGRFRPILGARLEPGVIQVISRARHWTGKRLLRSQRLIDPHHSYYVLASASPSHHPSCRDLLLSSSSTKEAQILSRFFRGRSKQPLARPPQHVFTEYNVGDTIAGKYLVHNVFEGGLGRVFVVSEGGDAPFILKTCKPEANAREFIEEARTWVGLGRHPYIVPAFWADYVAGMPCVAAEYISPDSVGRTSLRDHLRVSRPTLNQILRWAAQFCDAMQYASGKGLRAHRDVKPENLLTTAEGDLQLTDFGISAAQGENGADAAIVSGTPAYMAPEQWLGEPQDFRTDVYSFGIVLHELCVGRLPWRATSLPDLRRECLTAAIAANLPLGHPLGFVVGPMTMRDPSVRFPSPAVLRTAVQMASAAAGVALAEPPPPLNQEREELLAEASLSAMDQSDRAFAAAKKLTERWPSFASGWTQLGRLYLERGNLRDAGLATQRAIDLDGSRSAPWTNMGIIFHRAGYHRHAVELLEKALDRDPANTGAMINLAGPLTELGHSSKAIAYLEKATALAPDKVAAWINLGSLVNASGDASRADYCFRRGVECVADNDRSAVIAQIRRVAPSFGV